MSSKKGGKGSKSQSPTPSSLSVGSPAKDRKSAKGVGGMKGIKDEEKETLAFKFLNQDTTKELLEVDDVDELQKRVAGVLKITQEAIDLKDGATVDFFVSALWWAKEQAFTAEQLSAFYTVLHILFGNVREQHMTLVDNLRHFRKMLIGIGQENPEKTGGLETCFDAAHVKLLSEYLYAGLFQHYKLYEFMFSTNQAEEIIGTDLAIEVVKPADFPWPPPLQEGVCEEIHCKHIATPPPTPEKQDMDSQTEGPEGTEDSQSMDQLAEERQHEADVVSQLDPEQVQEIMNSVFEEMLSGLQTEIAVKLREKENTLITRINKLQVVADK